MKKIKNALLASFKMLLIMTVVCGGLYTVLVTGLAQLLFPYEANGSVIKTQSAAGDELIVGSALIGQSFTEAGYLVGRPGEVASNLSPTSSEQKLLVAQRYKELKAANQEAGAPVPSELLLASASGVDPEISASSASYQIPRIAANRQLSQESVRAVIEKHTSGQLFGKIGTAKVNVLKVNLELSGYALTN